MAMLKANYGNERITFLCKLVHVRIVLVIHEIEESWYNIHKRKADSQFLKEKLSELVLYTSLFSPEVHFRSKWILNRFSYKSLFIIVTLCEMFIVHLQHLQNQLPRGF